MARIRIDSRKVAPGDIFLAVRGLRSDGHRFIQDAIAKGASKIVYDDSSFDGKISILSERVSDSRSMWPYLEAASYQHPEQSMQFIGVTGTNGKTSTVQMTKNLFHLLGVDCLVMGTLGAELKGKLIKTGLTTPDPDVLFKLLHEARKQGVKYTIMEVSSHAIALKKFGPIRFNVSGFTSFSQDHLDFHKDLQSYFDCKIELIKTLSAPNATCFVHKSVFDMIPSEVLKFPVTAYCDETNFPMRIDKTNTQGMHLDVGGRKGVLPFFGDFLAENFVCALLMTEFVLRRRVEPTLWNKLNAIRGRLEPVERMHSNQPTVLVDYAHTPDGLKRALLSCRKFTKGKLIVVFGCGGDRDRAKRPLMGEIAEQLADVRIVTSDNPRHESPQSIIDEIVSRMLGPYSSFVDRKDAIIHAIKCANANDTILIAGKGHEEYQTVGDRNLPFDDRLVAEHALKALVEGKKP